MQEFERHVERTRPEFIGCAPVEEVEIWTSFRFMDDGQHLRPIVHVKTPDRPPEEYIIDMWIHHERVLDADVTYPLVGIPGVTPMGKVAHLATEELWRTSTLKIKPAEPGLWVEIDFRGKKFERFLPSDVTRRVLGQQSVSV